MDRDTLLRWSVIALAGILFWQFGMPLLRGDKSEAMQTIAAEHYVNAPGFRADILDSNSPGAAASGEADELCELNGGRYVAQFSSRGAGLTHLFFTDKRYANSAARDLSTTPDHERWRSFRTLFRPVGESHTDDQIRYDRFNWKLAEHSETNCTFVYEDEVARIEKSFAVGERPFEINVNTKITNRAPETRRHTASIETFAFHPNSEIHGKLGRVSPFQTELSCASGKEVVRKGKDDFKQGWASSPSVNRYAAVSNYYFAQALIPLDDQRPECRILAEDWYGANQHRDDDEAGAVYHAQLVYPTRFLGPNETATYRQIAFMGPKEREILDRADGGKAGLGEVINLGFFSPVAKVLVGALVFLHDHVTFGNWGLAIIALTIALRILLFPLTWKSIQTTIAMRTLKPDLDALNARFKNDAQAKNIAMMELYRKHGVNPFGGCLPQLVQMPVWFAMYTTLQTAAEMYNTKFLWFADMSAPDKYYILPLVLGAFMIVQQRLVPQQGMDAVQQKMMTYMMPIIFTVMMLFLPAALGIYMLTNSVLGIVQQLAIEHISPRTGTSGKGEIIIKQSSHELRR